jgi:hypothetical protein
MSADQKWLTSFFSAFANSNAAVAISLPLNSPGTTVHEGDILFIISILMIS